MKRDAQNPGNTSPPSSRLVLVHNSALIWCGKNSSSLRFWIDFPNQPCARLKTFLAFDLHLALCVALTEHLHRQIRNQLRNRIIRNPTARQTRNRVIGHIGSTYPSGKQTNESIRNTHNAQFLLSHPSPKNSRQCRGQYRFAQSHSLLHQDSIHKFKQAVFMRPQYSKRRLPVAVLRKRMQRTPFRRNITQTMQDIRHGFGLCQ